MQIVVAILGAIAAISSYWFTVRRIGNTVGKAFDAAERPPRTCLGRLFSSKASESPITAIDDPRTAAVVMAVAIAGGQRGLNDAQTAELYRVMRDILQVDDPEEEFTFARWVAREVPDANSISLRLSTLWNGVLNLDERRQLVELVRDVASAGNKLTQLQADAIDRLKARLVLSS